MYLLTEGQHISERFTLLNSLGKGGMGEVWLAREEALGIQVALKILKPSLSSSPNMVRLLREECHITQHLYHPNIVRIFDFHSIDPYHFISMEYIGGKDFHQFVGSACDIFLPKILPVINALSYAHERGVIHRDVKLSNILLTTEDTVKLTDFGIAAAIHTDQDRRDLSSGGSPYSMSPQQLQHHKPHHSDDIYALGAVLYELIMGYPPFYPHITREKILSQSPASIPSSALIPSNLETLVMAMLAKEPDDRPADMEAVSQEISTSLTSTQNDTIPPHSEDLEIPKVPAPENITPIQLNTSKQFIKPPKTPPKRKVIPAKFAWLGLALLCVGAFAVLYFLPRIVDQSWLLSTTSPGNASINTQQTPETSVSVPHPSDKVSKRETQPSRNKEYAEQMLQDLIEKQHMLDSKGVKMWASEPFQNAQNEVSEGDDFFRRDKFISAAESYSNAITILDRLLARVDAELGSALTLGMESLAARDGETAQQAFQVALAIDSTNERASKGLARTATLERVIELFDAGTKHEKNNELDLAKSKFKKAFEIDPDFEDLRTAISRITDKLAQTQFNQAMSEGFAALDRKDMRAARKAFEAARQLNPQSRGPIDGLTQVDLYQRLDQIAQYRKMAKALEQQEQWEQAAKQYIAALKIDPSLIFAKQGKTRTLARAKLSQALDHFIKHPERLSSESVLQEAIRFKKKASDITDKGPKLRRQIATLSETIDVAKTPISVRFESDNETEVMVYKVGKLGRFQSRELNLRPGNYTAVGTRNGFRDVHHRFSVVAGKKSLSVIVRCEEKI